ncbi:hypothetical protein [Streptomyces sp. NPDC056690]|uniref:hypothetical protein n=1 Tax=unclassified Streptomyces TaxID=2593676 RepID=UPI00362A4FFA
MMRLAELRRGEESERWYRRAAEAGNQEAMMRLVDVLLAGNHYEKAERWYRRATGEEGPFPAAYIRHAYRSSVRSIESLVTTVVITAAAIPFLQTVMAKAGENGYNAARQAVRRLSGRQQVPLPPAADDDMSSVILHVPLNVPDDALRRLANMDLAALRRASDAQVIEVSWDDAQQEWKVVTRGGSPSS